MLSHIFQHCRNYVKICITLMNKLNDIDDSIISRQRNELLRIILDDGFKFKDNVNKWTLIATIQFIRNSNRVNQSSI